MSPSGLRDRTAIVGVAESDIGKTPGHTVFSLQQQAMATALRDAGLRPADVDGFMTSGYPYTERQAVSAAEYLGLRPRYVDDTNIGGSGFIAAMERAAAAIECGLCETVLITYGSTQYSSKTRALGGRPADFGYQFEVPYGLPLPLGGYALAAQRYMHLYGAGSADLAEVAVAARQWARLNPKAVRTKDLTVDDVLASPMISTPLRGLDCCLVTDGGGAVVMTSAERARDLRADPVLISGTGYAQSHESIGNAVEITDTAARESGRLAYTRAGFGPSDIDIAQIYDSFTITVLLSLEDLGLCGKGEAAAFVADGRIRPGGDFPLNTSGGGLSYCHPGMFGIFLIIEAVRQLRGEAGNRQAGSPRTALCHGTGGQLSTAATAILRREAA
ncbi:acetyl-CoA acetyltransferase [Spirillospora sp. CA-128828]|uniref:acetyl-CoA acetyltransferase n=1 Tax=Spirillospora sp. CA-128828 TaxID=3240033 RepID=UPI003D9042E6